MTGIRQFIAGRWTDGGGPATMSVLDPATGAMIAEFPAASEADVTRAAESAERGFAAWRNLSPWVRGQTMQAIASAIRARREALARAITQEQGKPLAESLAEADRAADFIAWGAAEALRLDGRLIPGRSSDVDQLVRREPVGPAALFTPWNFPAVLIAKKLAAALAAGCSVVVKPSEEAPTAAVLIVEACLKAGVPPEAVNLVIGEPAPISTTLLRHPAIRKLSFTGSTAVGRQLAAQAGAAMMPVTMELGGHAPVVITADVDVEAVAHYVAARKFANAGQACISPTRFLVERAVHDRFVAALAARADALRLGPGLEPGVEMGPLANARRRTSVRSLVDEAIGRGARAATARPAPAGDGFFLAPTVLVDVDPAAEIMSAEPFGPVAPVVPFDSLDQAIALANQTRYGLAAYAFSDNPRSQRRLRDELRAGMVGLNCCPAHLPELPMGGWQDSGIGVEGGIEAIAAYQQSKLMCTVADTRSLD